MGQPKDLPRRMLRQNEEAIRFLYKKGMTTRQIRYLNYRQVDPKRKIIHYDKRVWKFVVRKRIHYAMTPVEDLLIREPISQMYVLCKKTPFRNFYHKVYTILPPQCFYSDKEIKDICGVREEVITPAENEDAYVPLPAQEKLQPLFWT